MTLKNIFDNFLKMENDIDLTEKKLKEFSKTLFEMPEKVFLISDTHFNHKNILEYEPERQIYLNSHSSFEDFVVEKWNEIVSDEDFVLHLGDFLFYSPEIFFEKYQLKGKILLIPGNHDRNKNLKFLKEKIFLVLIGIYILENNRENYSFKQIPLEENIKVNGIIATFKSKKILFSHYPVYEYDRFDLEKIKHLRNFFEKYNCNFNIHGHVHNKPEVHNELLNVSVERIGFSPKKLSEIL